MDRAHSQPRERTCTTTWWARTVSNRRPLVCKSLPGRTTRFTRCHSALKCPGQRLVRVYTVRRLSGCVCLSWHILGATGVWPLGARSHLSGDLPPNLSCCAASSKRCACPCGASLSRGTVFAGTQRLRRINFSPKAYFNVIVKYGV
jgi:hypothetical protein